MTLQVNQLLEYAWETATPRVDRILYLDSPGTQVVCIDIFHPRALPCWQPAASVDQALASEECRVRVQDPRACWYAAEEDLPELYRQHRDRAWAVIQDLVLDERGQPRLAIFMPATRGALVAACAQSRSVSAPTLYGYLRRYWQYGQTKNALLPAYPHCGARGQERIGGEQKLGRPSACARATGQTGVVIDDHIQKQFARGVKMFYEIPKGLPLTKTFQRTLETCFNTGYELRNGTPVPILPPADELPTFRQFQYWYAKRRRRNLTDTLKSREGERRFNLSSRPILGDATQMAFGPGSIFQIDATMADLYLVSALDPGRIIGRPVLYIVVDVFSHLVAGFSVSLEGPSWLGAMLALENATTNKVAFCAEYGLTIAPQDWPVHHLPKELLADRGELEGFSADQVVNGLNVSLSNTAPYRAEWKAIVERHFRLTNDRLIHWVPGAVYRPRERGERDYRLDACLNLSQFRSLLIHLFLFHNRFHELQAYRRDADMLRDHVEPYPLDLWNWGLQSRVGQLRCMDPELIRLNLLPEDEASVTAGGIFFRKRQYDCRRALDEQWYVRARAQGRWKIRVLYEPRELDRIYLRPGPGERLETCYLHDNERTLRGRDWYEILDREALELQQEPARRSRRQQAEAELDAQIASLVEPARAAAQAERQGLTQQAILQGIRENRAEERARERLSGTWSFADAPESIPVGQADAVASVEGSAGCQALTPGAYVPPPRYTARLQQLDKELLNHE